MASKDEKTRIYWLKIECDSFRKDEFQTLLFNHGEMGHKYLTVYLFLSLKAAPLNGYLYEQLGNKKIEVSSKIIASNTNVTNEEAEKIYNDLKEYGLIVKADKQNADKLYYMPKVKEAIASVTKAAIIKAKQRERAKTAQRIKEQKAIEKDAKEKDIDLPF